MRKGQNDKADSGTKTRTLRETEDYSLDEVVPFQYQASSSLVNPFVLSALDTRTALEYLTNERMVANCLLTKGEGQLLRYQKEGLGWGDGLLCKGLATEV